MADNEFFSVVPPAEAEAIKKNASAGSGKWAPVTAALARGETLRVRVKTNQVGPYSRDIAAKVPGKRLASRKSDDPQYRYLWLVDR